jgi:hypothetical protein
MAAVVSAVSRSAQRMVRSGLCRLFCAKRGFGRGAGGIALNPRQVDMLNRLLDRFEGKLTTGKWAKISKCSPDTALRDINQLVSHGILLKEAGGGRSTSYLLCEAHS